MSYSNKFTLIVSSTKLETIKYCPKCKLEHDISDNFCSKDGSELSKKLASIDTSSLIVDFLKLSDEARMLLKPDGSTKNLESGRVIFSDIKEFSKSHPEILFQIKVDWDEVGTPPTIYFTSEGEQYSENAEIVFPEFNKLKLNV